MPANVSAPWTSGSGRTRNCTLEASIITRGSAAAHARTPTDTGSASDLAASPVRALRDEIDLGTNGIYARGAPQVSGNGKSSDEGEQHRHVLEQRFTVLSIRKEPPCCAR